MKLNPFTSIIALCLFLGIATLTYGQSFEIPGRVQEQRIAIVDATIHPVSSETIDRGYIVFEDGLITAVGSGALPSGLAQQTTIVSGEGKHVYPGLIGASTIIGLYEIGQVDATLDYSEYGTYTPEVRAITAVNPSSALIGVARANGILTVLSVPQGGIISGYASTIRLDGWTNEEMSIADRSGLVVRWPNVSPNRGGRGRFGGGNDDRVQETLEEIDELFAQAGAYAQARSADSKTPVDLRLASLEPVVSGEIPIYVFANDAARIRSAVAWANRHGRRIVIVGGSEADDCAELLKAHNVGVIIEGVHRMPRRRDAAYDDAFTLPKRLHEAGVPFCIASGEEPAHERSLPHHAGTAVAYGLPESEAIRSLTLSAAQLLGIGETHGSLEPGKVATLIITTGSPLEITTDVLGAYIDGSEVDLDSRHKALDRKYRQRYEHEHP